MRTRPKSLVAAGLLLGTGLPLPLAGPAMAGDSYRSPLSERFSGHTQLRPGGTVQPPSLWYYGPSYSTYYDSLPPRSDSTPRASDYYRPSYDFDPYYGHARPWPWSTWPWARY